MAKELPYFKFEPNQWENGEIQIVTREDKGLFIDLCSMYWSRLGDVPFKLAVQKLCGGNATAFDTLINEGIFTIKNDHIYIEFLSEQLNEFENQSETNKQNALSGWDKRRANAAASKSQSENNAIREEKRREEKRKGEKINIPTFEEFKNYALEKDEDINLKALKFKYEAWVENDWKTGKNVKIKNWKSTLLNTIPHLVNSLPQKKSVFHNKNSSFD